MARTEGLTVTPPEALTLMAASVAGAARMFEAADDNIYVRVDFERRLRLMSEDDEIVMKAGLAFYDSLYEAHERMKEED